MIKTMELGPHLNVPAPDFGVLSHTNHVMSLESLMGERGLGLGFSGDIWEPASVRRILWFQRYFPQFARLKVNLGLLLCNQPHQLYGYSMSSVTRLEFPLLADVNREVHALYNMERYAGLVVVDATGIIRDKWLMPDERVWPKAPELMAVLELL
jgi:peroxiredoxin